MKFIEGIFNWFIILVVGTIIYAIYSVIKDAIKEKLNKDSEEKVDHKEDIPKEIIPIEQSEGSFKLKPFKKFKKSLPYLDEDILSVKKDIKRLESYASELDKHRYKAEKVAEKAIKKFNDDYNLLKEQQEQIFKRALIAEVFITRFEDIKDINLDSLNYEDDFTIELPEKPTYITPAELERKYESLASGVGTALGKIIPRMGSQGNNKAILVTLAIATATMYIKAKSNISKSKRSLENAKGDISNYCLALKATVSILLKSHEEIVNLSHQLKAIETKLISTIEKVSNIPESINNISSLDQNMKEEVLSLYFLILKSERIRKQKI